MRRNIINILILLVFSSFLIFFKFNEIPANISYDEIEFAQLAQSLDQSSYIPYSPLATGHSTLYFYIILGSFKIFGINNFALRLPAAIFGILAVFMFYLVMRQVFHPPSRLPLLSSLIFVSSRWYLNFARFSFEATFLIFLELTAIYFFLKKKIGWTAFFAGLSFLSYTSGRIFFLLPIAILFVQKLKKEALKYFLIVLLVTSPLILYLIIHPDARIQELISFELVENLKKTFLMFFFAGDMNGRHNFPGKPALNPLLGIFFVVGLIQGLKNIHKPNNQLFAGLFFLSLIPTLFTIPADNPNMLRTVTALPSIVYFSVLPLIRIYNLRHQFKNLMLFAFCILLLVSSLYELRTYFLFQSRVMKNSFEIKCNIQEVIKYKIREIPKNCRVNKNEF